ncbi:hypothetical protein BGZ76_002231 [Entomortierella beljakovae]|nr:hypothetical protein BGZ76_002231 [Entomortierella beljakovae]
MDSELKNYFHEITDIEKANHFDFFDRVSNPPQGSVERTWLSGLKALADSGCVKFVLAAEVLQKKYAKSKKDGLLKSYWKERQEHEDLVEEANQAANETAKHAIRSSRLKTRAAFATRPSLMTPSEMILQMMGVDTSVGKRTVNGEVVDVAGNDPEVNVTVGKDLVYDEVSAADEKDCVHNNVNAADPVHDEVDTAIDYAVDDTVQDDIIDNSYPSPRMTLTCPIQCVVENHRTRCIWATTPSKENQKNTVNVNLDSTSADNEDTNQLDFNDDECEIEQSASGSDKNSVSSPTKRPRSPSVTTVEPWRTLAVAIVAIYQGQTPAGRDPLLIKDAQVSMSCLLNTISASATKYFQKHDSKLLDDARQLSHMPDFTNHPSSAILRGYRDFLVLEGVEGLLNRVIADRAYLRVEHRDHKLPPQLEIHDKTLRILEKLCEFILTPPFPIEDPSESDCLQLWVSIFAVLIKNIQMKTGETILSASKIMRKLQSLEHGDVSEGGGRKVDCIFVANDVEISNIEFKRSKISGSEIAIQNRKNVRLARCIQEEFRAIGMNNPVVLMADVQGTVQSKRHLNSHL